MIPIDVMPWKCFPHYLTHQGRDKMAASLADDVFKCIFLNENVWILIIISLKFVPWGPVDNKPVLVQDIYYDVIVMSPWNLAKPQDNYPFHCTILHLFLAWRWIDEQVRFEYTSINSTPLLLTSEYSRWNWSMWWLLMRPLHMLPDHQQSW